MGMTWKEICNDPLFAETLYKVESDEWGNVIMSPPPSAAHSEFQGEIIITLARLMPNGHAQPEYPLQTNKGVKGIDAVWVSSERRKQKPKNSLVHLIAPEICVEVLSPRNTRAEINRKVRLDFQRGASECWICDKKGSMSFFGPSGVLARSLSCPEFPLKLGTD